MLECEGQKIILRRGGHKTYSGEEERWMLGVIEHGVEGYVQTAGQPSLALKPENPILQSSQRRMWGDKGSGHPDITFASSTGREALTLAWLTFWRSALPMFSSSVFKRQSAPRTPWPCLPGKGDFTGPNVHPPVSALSRP